MRVQRILTGLVQHRGSDGIGGPFDGPWVTAMFKETPPQPTFFDIDGICGDERADPTHHGGPDKAVLAYSAEHYQHWRAELNTPDVGPGGFGENLVVGGQNESSVCIGDVYRLGDAVLQVCQPRQPGWKMARRWHWSRLPRRMGALRFTGWYLRVLEAGIAIHNTELVLESRSSPEWTVERAVAILYSRHRDPDDARRLAACETLAESWRSKLAVRFKLDR